MAKTSEIRITEIWRYVPGSKKLEIPLFSAGVSAGFPSPADDSLEKSLDLNEFLIKHPSATYYVRVEGTSMVNAGIHSGDVLIVDWALEPKSGDVVVAMVEGEFTVKRFRSIKGTCWLFAENPDFKPIEIRNDMDVEVRGVVTWVLHKV
jgi:DNA polymerase V